MHQNIIFSFFNIMKFSILSMFEKDWRKFEFAYGISGSGAIKFVCTEISLIWQNCKKNSNGIFISN